MDGYMSGFGKKNGKSSRRGGRILLFQILLSIFFLSCLMLLLTGDDPCGGPCPTKGVPSFAIWPVSQPISGSSCVLGNDCIDYLQAENPEMQKDLCRVAGGNFRENSLCATGSMLAVCKIVGTQSFNSDIRYYFSSGWNLSSAESNCETNWKGSFTTL